MMAVGIVLFVLLWIITQGLSERQIENTKIGYTMGVCYLIAILLMVASVAKFVWNVMP
jgi:low temperature requirement protein LtrA